jgi:hypothetical protein
MFQSVESQLSFVALFVCCGLAIWKGGAPERGGALMILVTWLGATLIQAVAKAYILPILFLVSDAVLAAGLLLLAIRYSSLWMGAAMLLQAIGLSLHAAYFAAEKADLSRHTLWLYIAGKNVASFAMLLVILAAGIVAWRKRSLRAAGSRTASAPAFRGQTAAG